MDCGGFGVVYWKCSGSGCSWLFIRPEVAASWQPFMESNISQSSHHFKPLSRRRLLVFVASVKWLRWGFWQVRWWWWAFGGGCRAILVYCGGGCVV